MDHQKYELLNVYYTKYKTLIPKKFEKKQKWEKHDEKKVVAFIPGTILKILVKEGKKVKAGSRLCILEAMKMKNRLLSPVSGTIKTINVKEGQIVAKNELLFEYE